MDVGGTNIKWVHLLDDGTIVDQGTVPTPEGGPLSVVDAIVGCAVSAGAGRPARIGVAIPGHVNTKTGHTALVPNVAGDWTGFAFGPELGRAFGVTTAVINDARAFGTAELTLGAAAGEKRAVFATIGTGIGGAIALDGRILRNESDGIGELGHSTVVRNGDLCGCGNRGCAEAYAGARAMVRRYREISEHAGRTEGDTHRQIDLLRQRFDDGEQQARSVVDTATWAVGSAITTACVTLGIQTAVIGGGLAGRWPEFQSEISLQLSTRENLIGRSNVLLAQLGDNAGAIGAAVSASRH
ncbi:ROK family protein [Subtercola boreus]|uniref:ROK family protein n=1 Tax=Subtercola boreus TaxID=120213 RepID=UPI0015598324|nr:ROK family protein [Subtercola boreus]